MDTDEIFNMYDKNGSGNLNKKEFKKAWKFVEKLNGGEIEGRACKIRRKIDVDGNKKICQNEFRTWLCHDLGLCEEPSEDEDDDNDENDNDDEDNDDDNDDDEDDDNDDDDDNEDDDKDEDDNDKDEDDNDKDEDEELIEFNNLQLKKHNEYRRVHGVPDLEFDAGLAEDALEWSKNMYEYGKLVHSRCTEKIAT